MATEYAAWSPTANQFREKTTFCGDCAPGAPRAAARTANVASIASVTCLIVASSRRVRPGRPRARGQPDRTVEPEPDDQDRKSTRLNSSHSQISYAVFCLKKKNVSDYSTSRAVDNDQRVICDISHTRHAQP